MDYQLDIFEATKAKNIPLAEKIRPSKIEDILNQESLLSEKSILRKMIEEDSFSSFILWGPPGCGKTTIVRLIEQKTKHNFISFSAVFSSIKEIKSIMKDAEYDLQTRNIKTILFIDEIHRFNKSQQDAFLPYVESGAIILIGATTENPSFEIISALLSRCHVFVLNSLKNEGVKQILISAIKYIDTSLSYPEDVLEYLSRLSGGDARKALNNLELILKYPLQEITVEKIQKILTQKTMFYDKNGEEHYNLISALHKSLRGSDVQAGLYWLARILESGEDPKYIVRRLIRFASEDIGLADPNALIQAITVKDAVIFLGMPECSTALSQLVIYLATAPKSNSAYTAYKKAKKEAMETSHYSVPLRIRNAPTTLMKKLNYGKNYKYSHDYENGYSYQKYFPDGLEEKQYYYPSKFGFEKEIKKRLDWWNNLKSKNK
jgi:putative ATPase